MWEHRDRGADRNPQWEIAGVDDDLIAESSGRSRDIEREKERLIEAYIAEHGRRPSNKTIVLAPRPGHPRHPAREGEPLAGEAVCQWRQRASRLLDMDANQWAASLASNRLIAPLGAQEVSLTAVGQVATRMVEADSDKRSTWRHWNL